tara:strand:+ start:963 stop:1274 length:312 start_codon:yes stop_codon:yes gene_type:complete
LKSLTYRRPNKVVWNNKYSPTGRTRSVETVHIKILSLATTLQRRVVTKGTKNKNNADKNEVSTANEIKNNHHNNVLKPNVKSTNKPKTSLAPLIPPCLALTHL